MTYGNIWPGSKLTAKTARNEYVCETPDCRAQIHRGDTYYTEYRGGLESIPRCSACAEKAKAA